MVKRIVALVLGIALITIGILALVYYGRVISSWQLIMPYCPPPGQCFPFPNRTDMAITYPKAIELGSSKPVVVYIRITDLRTEGMPCPSVTNMIDSVNYQAQLSAAGMEISPETTQTSNNIPINGVSDSEWTWIVYPKQAGTYTINAKISATTQRCQFLDRSQTFEIQVVDIFGLTATQLRIIGWISSFLGSALTLPGIFAIWMKLEEIRVAKNDKSENTNVAMTDSALDQKEGKATYKKKKKHGQ